MVACSESCGELIEETTEEDTDDLLQHALNVRFSIEYGLLVLKPINPAWQGLRKTI